MTLDRSRRFIGQFLWTLAGQGLGALVQGVVLFLVAQRVQPSGFGALAGVLGVATVLQTLTDMGLAPFVLRERSAQGDTSEVATAVRINSWSSLLLFVLASAVIVILASVVSGAYWSLLPLGVSIAADRNCDTKLTVAYADGRAHATVLATVGRRVLALALFVVLVSVRIDPLSAYAVSAGTASLIAAVGANVYIRSAVRSAPTVRWRQVIRRSLPYWAEAATNQIRSLDTLLVTVIGGTGAAGLYGASIRFTNPLNMVGSSLAGALVPAMTRKSGSNLRHLLRPATIVFIVNLTGLGFAFVIAPFVGDVLGSRWLGFATVFRIIVCGILFYGLSSICISALLSMGMASTVAIISSVCAFVTLGSIAFGASLEGALGASIGWLLSYLIQFVWLAVEIRGVRRARLRAPLI